MNYEGIDYKDMSPGMRKLFKLMQEETDIDALKDSKRIFNLLKEQHSENGVYHYEYAEQTLYKQINENLEILNLEKFTYRDIRKLGFDATRKMLLDAGIKPRK